MLSVSTLIDFLMNLMRDEDARAAFDQDPQGELTRHGLDGVSAQDVRDARLIMADDGGVRPRSDGGPGSNHHDPVREIHHTTNHYEVTEAHPAGGIDQTLNVINIDDRDTVVVDSFNSADTNDVDVVAIQDNSTEIDIEDSFNDEDEPEPEEGPAGGTPADPAGTPAGETSGEPAGEPGVDTGEPAVDTDPIESEPADDASGLEPEVSIDPAGIDPAGIDPIESEPADEPELDPAIV